MRVQGWGPNRSAPQLYTGQQHLAPAEYCSKNFQADSYTGYLILVSNTSPRLKIAVKSPYKHPHAPQPLHTGVQHLVQAEDCSQTPVVTPHLYNHTMLDILIRVSSRPPLRLPTLHFSPFT
jgi:hypothetical protein